MIGSGAASAGTTTSTSQPANLHSIAWYRRVGRSAPRFTVTPTSEQKDGMRKKKSSLSTARRNRLASKQELTIEHLDSKTLLFYSRRHRDDFKKSDRDLSSPARAFEATPALALARSGWCESFLKKSHRGKRYSGKGIGNADGSVLRDFGVLRGMLGIWGIWEVFGKLGVSSAKLIISHLIRQSVSRARNL